MAPHVHHANPYGAGAKGKVSNQGGGESVLVCIRANILTQCQGPMAGCTLVYPSLILAALFFGVGGMTGVCSASYFHARFGSLA